MNETNLVPLLSFTGEAINVLEVVPQTTASVTPTAPTTGFDQLLAGLIVAQANGTAQLTGTTPGSELDPNFLLAQDIADQVASQEALEAAVNDQLRIFFNVAPSGVPLPSQQVRPSTLPELPNAESLNPANALLSQNNSPSTVQQEPITLEQIRIRGQAAIPTITTNSNTPPLTPVVTASPTEGTVLARPPQPDDVRSRIPEIGAVAASVTNLRTNLESSTTSNSVESNPISTIRSTGTPTNAAFVLPQAPVTTPSEPATPAINTDSVVAPSRVGVTAATELPAASFRAPTTSSTPTTPTPLPVGSLPTEAPGALVATPDRPEGVFVAFNNFAAPRPATTAPTNIVPPVNVPNGNQPTPPKGIATTANPPVAVPTINPAASTVAPVPVPDGVVPAGSVVPAAVEVTVPNLPTTLNREVSGFSDFSLKESFLRRQQEIAGEVPATPPTQVSSGEPVRLTEVPVIASRTSVSVSVSVLQQTADSIIREARLTQTPGESEFRLRLHPVELGEIRIHLRSTAEGISAQVSVASDSVRIMIENQLPELRQRLSDSGVTVNSFTVSTESGSSGRGGQQGTPFRDALNEPELNSRPGFNNRSTKNRPSTSSIGLDVTA